MDSIDASAGLPQSNQPQPKHTPTHWRLFQILEAFRVDEAIAHLGAGPALDEFTDAPRGHG